MTVKELIEDLKKCDPDAVVVAYDNIEECDFEVGLVFQKHYTDDEIKHEKYRYVKGDSVIAEKKLNKIVYLS